MHYVAQLTDHRGKTRLTLRDYDALQTGGYALVIDGFAEPPVCHRDGQRQTLTQDEFDALAKLVRKPGAALAPRADLFGGRSASNNAAIRRFEKARQKVEPVRPRRGGIFRTIGDGDESRYAFQPSSAFKFCLIERLESPMPLSLIDLIAGASTVPWALPTDAPSMPSYTSAAMSMAITDWPELPAEPPFNLTAVQAPPVEGMHVRVRSLAVEARHVRARVTIRNNTSEPRTIAYFTLHVGDRSWKAVRYRQHMSRRRGSLWKAPTFTSHEHVVVSGNASVSGLLLFPRPKVEGDVEATVRPHVLVQQIAH